MNDGHSGIENKEVNRGTHGSWPLVLSYLKQGNGEGAFVIHATSNYTYGSGLQPTDFLAEIGFQHYGGLCIFHRDQCFYRILAVAPRTDERIFHDREVHRIHEGFTKFSERISELFSLRRKEAEILQDIGVHPTHGSVFSPVVQLAIEEKAIPLWVEDVKYPRLKELEMQKNGIQEEIDDLHGFLPLLFGTGDVLENAVLKALCFLGLEAKLAPKGFTADILAQTKDGSRTFGFEVTGIAESIKKSSRKLTQVMDFERIKEHGEKTVLIANTHNTTPILQRKELEDFTQPVLDFLGKHPILLMTSWDLYCMVRDVLAGSQTRESVIGLLYTNSGQLVYST